MFAPIARKPLMCWSTGREPIAQPPGSDTVASPKRASSGPSTRIAARIVFTRSYGASGELTLPALIVTRSGVASLRSADAPMLRSSFIVVRSEEHTSELQSHHDL